jgi:hypothetical protein
MEKKQTAVEWFYKKLKNYKSLNLTDKLIQDLYKQALQMEKEQIEMACNQQEFEDIDGLGICETISKGQQYYNETYGGNNE